MRQPERRAQHEVDVQPEFSREALGPGVGQSPLAVGLVGRDAFDGRPLARTHGLHHLFDLEQFSHA